MQLRGYRCVFGAGWVQVARQPRWVFMARYGHRVLSVRRYASTTGRLADGLVCTCGWTAAPEVMRAGEHIWQHVYALHLGHVQALELWLSEDGLAEAGWVAQVHRRK